MSADEPGVREGLAAALAECQAALDAYIAMASLTFGGAGNPQWADEARAALVALDDRANELAQRFPNPSPEEAALIRPVAQQIAAQIAEFRARLRDEKLDDGDTWKRGRG